MDRFWNKIDQSAGADGCWLWTGSLDSSGYGLFKWHGRLWKAHRFALMLSGRLPMAGQQACHSCDTRVCCNPEHLRWDTQQANMDDRQARGRWIRGRGKQKLTEETAAELKRRFGSGEHRGVLAAEFGISVPHVYKVGKGQTTYV